MLSRFSPAIQSHRIAVPVVVVAIAVWLYFATGNLLASASLPYFAEAWPTTRTAFWLRSSDPIRRRGRTLFWFYLAAAGWRAATSAFMAAIAIAIIGDIADLRRPPAAFEHSMAVMLIGLFATTLLGIVAVAISVARRVPVFVIPTLYGRCGGDFSLVNPTSISRRYFNYAVFVLTLSVFVPALLIGTIVAAVIANSALAPTLKVFTLVPILLGLVAAIPVYGFLSSRIIAPTPIHCWPDLFLLPTPPQSKNGIDPV